MQKYLSLLATASVADGSTSDYERAARAAGYIIQDAPGLWGCQLVLDGAETVATIQHGVHGHVLPGLSAVARRHLIDAAGIVHGSTKFQGN